MTLNQTSLDEIHLKWLKHFQAQMKRPLRVLHVGNIANNAYLNAKILRRVGVEADVLCYYYYHVMGCPEWEEIDIKHGYGNDDNHPRFSKKDLKKYERPRWFAQGPLDLCLMYFEAKNKGKWHRILWWRLMSLAAKGHKFYDGFAFFQKVARVLKNKLVGVKPYDYDSEKIISEFDSCFPHRNDRLTKTDIKDYLCYGEKLIRLFDHYDVIQGYSVDPILCLLFSKKPYVAFEHGTLRTFINEDSPLHRLNALAYRKANHVFITNGDCIDYAKKLGVENFSATIHPIDVEQHRKNRSLTKAQVKAKYQADVLLFCPLRHDWAIKGTHLHLQAFPLICQALPTKQSKIILVSWGFEIENSRQLIKKLGYEDQVIWFPPLCRESLISFMQSADVVLDQMALPCFGGTAPQALAVGTPVIMSYKPESTAFIVKQPAPIIPAFSPSEICEGVLKALDEKWLVCFQQQAREWVDNEHSTNRVINSHLEVYKKLIEDVS